MIHILLTVLAVIGKTLLILLGIVVALILCLLFAPVSYKAYVKKEDSQIAAKARVTWLLFLVRFHVRYEGKKVSYELYILGIPILRLIRRSKKRIGSGHRRSRAGIKTKKDAEDQAADMTSGDASDEVKSDISGEIKNEATDEAPGQISLQTEEKQPFFRKIWLRVRMVCGKIKEIYGFLTSESFRRAFPQMRKEVLLLLKHILPRHLKGYVEFGFEDPATTGQVLGGIGMFYGLLPGKLEIYPDFEEQKLCADIRAGGRIHLIYLVVHGVKIFKSYRILAKGHSAAKSA